METIPCEKCKGSGREPLPAVLKEVLNAVRAGIGTAGGIWGTLSKKCDATAINNRLERLRSYGLVTRTKGPGRAYIYKATPKKRKHRNG